MPTASIDFSGRALIVPDGDEENAIEATGTASVVFDETFELRLLDQTRDTPDGSPDTASSGE